MTLTAGTLSLVTVGNNSDSLSATAATSGTTPYSYQWYRSTSSNFSPGSGNAVSGATALTLNDTGLVPGTQYYYKMVVIDSAATPASASYSQLPVLTRGQSVLSLANVMSVSVSQPQLGIGELNTSNLALFTHENPLAGPFSAGYKLYLSPQDIATDFGSSSITYQMALATFSQNPNILANNGYFAVLPFVPSLINLTFSAVAASGTFTVTYNGHTSAAINWNDTASQIQAKLQAVAGLESINVSGSIASETLVVTMYGIYSPTALTATSSLLDGGSASITITVTIARAYESLNAAIVRTAGLIQYFGIMGTLIFPQSDMLAAAATIQAAYNIGFFVSNQSVDVLTGGMLQLLAAGSFTHSRALYYGDTALSALLFMASYAGLGLSVNFQGSNTTITMHLKTLNGVLADPSMNQTLLSTCIASGVDTYVSLQGVPKVFCSGANGFYDDIYNLLWFVTSIQVAGFNFLAQSSTKVPQTEDGMTGFKGALRIVCQQAVTNQYVAPGTWTGSTTFGNLQDFYANISNVGYYIYSQPVSQQNPVNRAARQAPLVQIAIKAAGAIHSADVIIFINE